jgi:DNA-binding transcriptional LysR family regulator
MVNRREVPLQNTCCDRTSYTFRLLDEYFRQDRLVLNTFIELGSMEAIKELVKLNLGIAFWRRGCARCWQARWWLPLEAEASAAMGDRSLAVPDAQSGGRRRLWRCVVK